MNAHDLFAQWEPVRAGLYQALDQVTDAQLHFSPRAGLWPLGQVACHIAGTEEGWLRHLIDNRWPGDESHYSLADYASVAALKALLVAVHEPTISWLAAMSAQDLDRVVDLPWGQHCSVGWIIWHVLEHEIHHRGEIYLMLGLLGMEAPDV